MKKLGEGYTYENIGNWFKDKDINMKVVSDICTADKRFERIKLEEIE